MFRWHPVVVVAPEIPVTSAAATGHRSPINIEEGKDLETMPTRSINSPQDAEPAVDSEFGASASPPPQASARRGHTQAHRQHGPILPAATHYTGVGADSGSELTGNGVGGAAQARHVDGAPHVTIDVAALQAAVLMRQPKESPQVTNRELVAVFSASCGSIDDGRATGFIVTVVGADTTREAKTSSADKYANVLLALFGVALSACSAAYPVIKQAAPDGYTTLAYGLSMVLAFVLLAGLLATSFDKSPSSVIWGKYALQLALGLTIGLLTWSICSLNLEHKLDVPIGIAGALLYVAVVLLFHCRKW